jgi:hypothetical protein
MDASRPIRNSSYRVRPRAASVKTEFRPSTPVDGPEIAALLLEAGLFSNMEPAQQIWKYWQERTDWPEARSFVMSRGGEIIAHAGIIPGSYASATGRDRIGHVIDWAARPGFTGAGMSLMKYVARLTGALLAVGGSEQTLKILPHLGFEPRGSVTGYVRTLRPARLLSGSGKFSWRLLPRFARSSLWTWAATLDHGRDWEVRRVSPNEVDLTSKVLPVPVGDTAVLERSEAMFRYMLMCPIAPMELYVIQKTGRVRGYFLLAFARSQARLVDCWVASENPFDWRDLMQCAIREAMLHTHAAELVTWTGDPTLSGCLLRCGFHARNTYIVQSLAGRTSHILAGNVRVQMLDNDAAYLHHPEHGELWA